MKYVWEDLPERKNCFTVKNTTMKNLNTGEVMRHYSTNTRITVVQKCVTPDKTYYRTADAARHCLDYAFEASAFGLPDEKAPSAHSSNYNISHTTTSTGAVARILKSVKKQKSIQKDASSKDGEKKRKVGLLSRIFRRKNG